MEASVVDLRYRMNDVLKALDRSEDVSILYRGKVKGTIKPILKTTAAKVRDHAFFNMSSDPRPVDEQMEELRGGRYRAV